MRIPNIVFVLVVSSFVVTVDAQDRSDFVFDQIDEFNEFNPEQADTRAKQAHILKLCKLSKDRWLFYRGTNHLYWADFTQDEELKEHLKDVRQGNKKTKIWLQGDLHADNFGAYHDANGEVVYGLNDFDESLIADYQYDVWRMATSLVLIANKNRNVNKEELKKIVKTFAHSYLKAVESFKGNNDEIEFAVTDRSAGKPLKKFLKKTERKNSRAKMLESQTILPIFPSESPTFDFDGKKNKFVKLGDADRRWRQIEKAMKAYRDTLDKKIGDDDFFTVKDIALRIGGTGGLSAERYYVLIEGNSASHCDDQILDIKEQTEPTPLRFLSNKDKEIYDEVAGGNHAKRHMVAYQALVPNPDPFLGWMTLPDEKQFSVRERSPYKEAFPVISDEEDKTELKDEKAYKGMAKEWGRILAAAHARSDRDFNEEYIDYSFEKQVAKATKNKKKEFAELTVKVAMDYADRVNSDYELYAENFREKLNVEEDCPDM